MTGFMMVGNVPNAVSFLCIPLSPDITDFISTSGWFYHGMAEGKTATLHILAKKANMGVDAYKAVN